MERIVEIWQDAAGNRVAHLELPNDVWCAIDCLSVSRIFGEDWPANVQQLRRKGYQHMASYPASELGAHSPRKEPTK